MVTIHICRPELRLLPDNTGEQSNAFWGWTKIAGCGLAVVDDKNIIITDVINYKPVYYNQETFWTRDHEMCETCRMWWVLFHTEPDITPKFQRDTYDALIAELRYHGIPLGKPRQTDMGDCD